MVCEVITGIWDEMSLEKRKQKKKYLCILLEVEREME